MINENQLPIKNILHLIFLAASLWLCTNTLAQPVDDHSVCSTCKCEMDEGVKAIQCGDGHPTEQDCLWDQMRSSENILLVQEKGLRCNAIIRSHLDQSEQQCEKTHSFDDIRKILNDLQLEELDKRIREASKSSEKGIDDRQVWRLSEGIEGAFNLCCPIDGCGETLDQIEGCNAAKCSNPECQSYFCYLCLEPQTDGASAHQHVKEHNGDYWELRPGYKERYHWLIVRKKLANLFAEKIHPSVLQNVMKFKKELLKEKKMWPLPAGQMTKKWLQELKSNSEISPEEKIELLQNEYIYRRKMNHLRSYDLIEKELKNLGAKVLVSLDHKDAQGLYNERERLANPVVIQEQRHQEPHPPQHLLAEPMHERNLPLMNNLPQNEVRPFFGEDLRVPHAFRLLGEDHMYQIGNLLWSATPDERRNVNEARDFCEALGGGSRLATNEDWETLARALGKGTERGYRGDQIADMEHFFHTSTGQLFNGATGNLNEYGAYRTYFRCVIELQ